MDQEETYIKLLRRVAAGVRHLYANSFIEWGLVLVTLLGFVTGTLYWYRPQMAQVAPVLWPWLVDSPLSVLGFALALPLVRRGSGPWRGLLATWAVFSNVKYGLWTIVFWLLWWQGAGTLTLESVTMTVTHAAMVGMGLSLLVYFRPHLWQVLVVVSWFVFNDWLDYWHGLAPRVPPGVSLEVLRLEQVLVTTVLTVFLLVARRRCTT